MRLRNCLIASRKHGLIWGVFAAFSFLAFWEAWRGRELIPYDFLSDMYPWTAYSISMAKESLFRTVNEFKLGGMPGLNFIAYHDPLYLPSLLREQVPAAFVQKLALVHYFLIAAALSVWLNERRRTLGWLSDRGIIALAASLAMLGICGPILRHFQHSNATEAYWWGMASVILLEAYLFKRSSLVLLLAAASFCWAFMRFPTSSIHWPLFIAPFYGYRIFARVPHHEREASFKHGFYAGVLCLLMCIPCALQSQHLFSLITLSKNIAYLDDVGRADLLAPFGAGTQPLSLMLCPLLLVIVSLAGFRTLGRIPFALALALLAIAVTFSLGSTTPFAAWFRTLYPPASLFRRPYAILYVAMAFLSSGLLQYWGSRAEAVLKADRGMRMPEADWLPLSLCAGCALFLYSGLKLELTPLIAVGVSLACVGLAQLRGWMLPSLLVSWIAVTWLPFRNSQWAPHLDDTGEKSQYRDSENWLAGAPTAKRVMRESFQDGEYRYRVLSLGMPADYGGFAGIMPFLNLGPDYGTLFPQKLNEHLKLAEATDMHATVIQDVIRKRGWEAFESPLDELSVRYLLLNPENYERYLPYFRAHPERFRIINDGEYFKVVERQSFRPFARLAYADGHERAVKAVRTAEGFAVSDSNACADGPAELRISLIPDSWWRATGSVAGKQLEERSMLAAKLACTEGSTLSEIDFVHTTTGFKAAVVGAVFAWLTACVAFALHVARHVLLLGSDPDQPLLGTAS